MRGLLPRARAPPVRAEGDPSESRLDVGQLRTVADELGGHADAYYEAFCKLRATREGRTRWGEKTPRHVYRLEDLLTAFPSGKVICLVRDPRAVAASYRDWHSHERGKDKDAEDREALDSDRDRARRSYDPLVMSLLWRSTVRAAYSAQHRFGSDRVHVQPYESLLVSPEGTLRELCEWLGLEYQSAMVEVPVVNSSYGEWHGPPQGISQEPLDRWRLTLPPTDVAVIQSAAGRLMDGLGYERESVRAGRTRVAAKWVTLPYVGARVVVLNRDRLGKTGNYLKRRVSLAFCARACPPSSASPLVVPVEGRADVGDAGPDPLDLLGREPALPARDVRTAVDPHGVARRCFRRVRIGAVTSDRPLHPAVELEPHAVEDPAEPGQGIARQILVADERPVWDAAPGNVARAVDHPPEQDRLGEMSPGAADCRWISSSNGARWSRRSSDCSRVVSKRWLQSKRFRLLANAAGCRTRKTTSAPKADASHSLEKTAIGSLSKGRACRSRASVNAA